MATATRARAGGSAGPVERRRRLALASRVLAALGGGYALTAATTLALATLLPGPAGEARLGASLLAFAVFAGAVVWVFAAASAARAWGGLALAALAPVLVLLLGGAP